MAEQEIEIKVSTDTYWKRRFDLSELSNFALLIQAKKQKARIQNLLLKAQQKEAKIARLKTTISKQANLQQEMRAVLFNNINTLKDTDCDPETIRRTREMFERL